MRLPLICSSLLLCLILTIPALAGVPGNFNASLFGTPYLMNAETPKYAPQVADGKTQTAVDVPAGGAVQMEWRQPRSVYSVRLVFDGPAPDMTDVGIMWWYRIWPDGGDGGWMKLDDPFNGRFVVAAAEPSRDGSSITLRIKPLDKSENPGVKLTAFDYRETYKIRATFKTAARLAEIQCYTDSNWKTAEAKIDLKGQPWDGRLEARNADIVSAPPSANSVCTVKVRYADNPDRLSPDRGYVIVRRGGKGYDFSFFVDDVVREGALKVRDINAMVSDASKDAAWQKPADAWNATVMETVAKSSEQTFDRAMRELPRKWIDHAHMGLPVLRQELSIDAFSATYTYDKSLRGIGRDVATSPQFPGEWSRRRFLMITHEDPIGAPSVKRTKRWLEDGYLPIVHSTWDEPGLTFHQTIFVAALDPAVTRKSLEVPKPAPKPIGVNQRAADFGLGLKADEPITGMNRITIRNVSNAPQTAYIWLKPNPNPSMTITKDGLLLLDASTKPKAGENLTPTWGQFVTGGKGEVAALKNVLAKGQKPSDAGNAIRYTVRLAPGETHNVFMKIPYIEQMTPTEIAQIKALDWDQQYAEVKSLWKNRLAKAIDQYSVPEPMMVNLYRTNLWHVLIGTDRDPSTGLYEHGAGTYCYPMYANEAMMVARMMDMRGEHIEARRIIEPCLVCQGMKGLPGNFKSKEGLLYAAAPPEFDSYTAQGYNMHHGWILWAAAEHYLWTRDKAYLKAIAPNLVAACDWVTRERQATKVLNPDGSRPVEYGLAPAGDLEDVEEYLYFYPTNAYYYLGMKTAVQVLKEIGNPETARLSADTNAYGDDIMASLKESMATSPVVKLLDGTYIPYIPPRAYVGTDCNEGWIREGLYPSLHMVDAGLVKPESQLATWMLQDLEDRIFLSEESAYGHGKRPADLLTTDKWFTWGGYNPQPNLLDNSIAYLKRGQTPNFVRAFFNVFSASIYPDTMCFAECGQPYQQGGGPDGATIYKTPDESKYIQWMRQMLVLEMGNDIYIGRGVPKAWMANGKLVRYKDGATYFGPISMEIRSAVASGKITAQVSLPTRNPAKTARVFLRHPNSKKVRSVTVNGKPWRRFDPSGEVALPGNMGKVTVVAKY